MFYTKIIQRFKGDMYLRIHFISIVCKRMFVIRPLRYEKVYLPLCKVADTPFHI